VSSFLVEVPVPGQTVVVVVVIPSDAPLMRFAGMPVQMQIMPEIKNVIVSEAVISTPEVKTGMVGRWIAPLSST
jgi:hypothetical protein